MSEILILGIAGIAVLGGLGLYSIKRTVDIATDTEGNRENKKAEQIGFATVSDKVKKKVWKYNINSGKVEQVEIEVGKGEYGPCVNDGNCQGNAFFGADWRCYGGTCTPLVSSESGIKYNPNELHVKKFCGKYYLLGDRSPCDRDSQCSSSGVTCDIRDPDCISAGITSNYYCDKENLCSVKSDPDWLNIRWKWDDPLYKGGLQFHGKYEENKEKLRILDLENEKEGCNEFKNKIKLY